jgi:uridylate kinase
VKNKYRRVLLKISGEALEGKNSVFNIDAVKTIAGKIEEVHKQGVEVGIVVGGGNIIRGETLSRYGFDRNQSDYMGMLATVINGLLFENVFAAIGVPAVVQSGLVIDTLTESVVLKKTVRHLREKKVVLFTGGTGSPYFTTDTAAALRACEIGADVLLKATKVDGVFDKDPEAHNDAHFFKKLSYNEVIEKNLKVMDMTAVSMCRDQDIPIIVFNIRQPDNILNIINGKTIGTVVSS